MLNSSHKSQSRRTASFCPEHPRAVPRPLYEALESRRLLSFAPAVSYAANATPSAVATADFNNDGKLDLVTCADADTGSVSVFLGNGAGGFGAAQRYVVGMYLSSIAVMDFNGDAKLDIVTADTGFGVLQVLPGNGDGTFAPAVTLDHWPFVWAVAAGDFTNDGHADLLITSYDWNSGASIFEVFGSSSWRSGAFSPGGVPAELNNDGKLDVVSPEVQVLLGNGDGSLQCESYYLQHPPLNGRAVAPGDFTGDGITDLIVAGYNNVLAVLRGKGDGDFYAPVAHTANGTAHTGVATADFSADGKLDAVVPDEDTGTVSLMLGSGDGTLRYAGAFATGSSPSAVAVGDFNGDGWPDVAVANAGSKTVSVLLNEYGGPVPPPPALPSLRIGDVAVTEGNTGTAGAAFTVTLSAASDQPVTVRYATEDQSAASGGGGDYHSTSDTLTFSPGETSRTVTISVAGDRLGEPDETFAVRLTDPANASVADDVGIGTILDDEPRLAISGASITEGASSTKRMTFTVTLSAAYDEPVTANFATANGTAKAGEDYVASSGTLTFAAGERVKTIVISVKGDKKKEANESLFVDLSDPSGNAVLDIARGVGTIYNDD